MVQPLWKNSLLIPPCFKHKITIEAKNSSPRYILKGIENACQNKTYTQVFTAILFIIGENNPNVNQLVNGQIKYDIPIQWNFI